MNSHNAKSEVTAREEIVRIETDRNDVRVLRMKLRDANELSIADDYDNGGDPYNSTGQHIALKAKQLAEE
jgi:hypothetical protein